MVTAFALLSDEDRRALVDLLYDLERRDRMRRSSSNDNAFELIVESRAQIDALKRVLLRA